MDNSRKGLKLPIYSYRCEKCNEDKEQYACGADYEKPIPCECGGTMRRTISMPGTDMVENIRYSSSMGCNPNKIQENMRKYPGSNYTPDGKLIVRSRNDKLKKLKQRGLVEA